jgi:peptidoglycan LD-endopeptidase CwlK
MNKKIANFIRNNKSMSRYITVSIIVFLATIAAFFARKSNTIQLKIGDEINICDTTQIPKYLLYDIAIAINSNVSLEKTSNRILLQIIDNEGFENIYTYNKIDSTVSFFIDSTVNFEELQLADSIVFKALIEPDNKLYKRWGQLLQPYRDEFVAKRKSLFEKLPEKLPNYDYRVISDFRQSENQAKLLKAGFSAAPLSAHQFGLASDIAIKRKGRYLTGFTFYKIMGEIAINQGLTWGGNFVGFVDPGHIQLFENSAKMLAVIPELRFEFEPFRKYYYQRIEKMTKAGKEKSIEDTKELVEVIDVLNENKICACTADSLKNNTIKFPRTSKLERVGYQLDTDVLLSINEANKEIKIFEPKKNPQILLLGTWK